MSDRSAAARVDSREPRPGRVGRLVDATELIAGLERLRDGFRRCLDHLEREVRAVPLENSQPSNDLANQRREFEVERSKFQSELERRDRDWQAKLEALEKDRQLLADAWERLEREQVSVGNAPTQGLPPVAAGPGAMAGHRSSDEPTAEDPISRAVLRQFESLRHDVRLRAEVRRTPGRPR